jgi:hypothetical protein
MVKIIGFSPQDSARIEGYLRDLPSEHTSRITSIEAGASVMGEGAYHSGGGRVIITPVGLDFEDAYMRGVLVHENAHAEHGSDEGRPCGIQADYYDSIGRSDLASHTRDYCRTVHHREPGSNTPVYDDQPPADAARTAPEAAQQAPSEPAEPSGWCDAPGRGGKDPKRFRIF